MTRPEWVRCVARRCGDPITQQHLTWCGQDVTYLEDMPLNDATTALANAENEGRLITCPQCAIRMIQLLSAHAWDGLEGTYDEK